MAGDLSDASIDWQAKLRGEQRYLAYSLLGCVAVGVFAWWLSYREVLQGIWLDWFWVWFVRVLGLVLGVGYSIASVIEFTRQSRKIQDAGDEERKRREADEAARVAAEQAQKEKDDQQRQAEEARAGQERERKLGEDRRVLGIQRQKSLQETDFLNEELQRDYILENLQLVRAQQWQHQLDAYAEWQAGPNFSKLFRELDLEQTVQVWDAKVRMRRIAERLREADVKLDKLGQIRKFKEAVRSIKAGPGGSQPAIAPAAPSGALAEVADEAGDAIELDRPIGVITTRVDATVPKPTASQEVRKPTVPEEDENVGLSVTPGEIVERYTALELPRTSRLKTEMKELAEEVATASWKNAANRTRNAIDLIAKDIVLHDAKRTGRQVDYKGQRPQPSDFRWNLMDAGIIDDGQFAALQGNYSMLSAILKGARPPDPLWVSESMKTVKEILGQYQKKIRAKKTPQT